MAGEEGPAAGAGKIFTNRVNLNLAFVLHDPGLVILLRVKEVATVHRSREQGWEVTLQRLQTFRSRGGYGCFARTPLHLVLYFHGPFGQRLSDGTVLRGPLQADTLCFGDLPLQGDHFPHAKPYGLRKLNRLHFEIDLDILQGYMTTVGHAYHRDHCSSGPSHH